MGAEYQHQHARDVLRRSATEECRGGSVVIASSTNGMRTFSSAGTTTSPCTKAAQIAMMQMAALELARYKIWVNAVRPGRTETEIPARRNTEAAKVLAEYTAGKTSLTGDKAGTAKDVAELVLLLVSDRTGRITGSLVWIASGQSLIV